MSIRTILPLLGLAVAAPAAAQGFRGVEVYGAQASDYGYAGEFVRGTYVGAPLTRFPRPTQIVPAPWSYGTYGIPTVSGIPSAPAAQPTLTVINAHGSHARGGEDRVENGRVPGIHVIDVQVPHR